MNEALRESMQQRRKKGWFAFSRLLAYVKTDTLTPR